MLDRSGLRRIALAAAAGGVALALVAAPIAPGGALAKGASDNGVENSDGRAGGNGQGQGQGNNGLGGSGPVIGNSGVGGEGGPGNGHGLGLDNDAVSGVDVSANGTHPVNHGALASMLGRLNAAHASPNAMENAAPHSAVGLTAQYYDALAADELDDAASLLADLANKQVAEEEVAAVVQAYNGLLGIEVYDSDPDPVATEPGLNDYEGFNISSTTESDLIDDVADEYGTRIGDGTFGGGLGPAP